MIKYPRDPVPGAGVSASWGRDVVRCLRAMRVVAGAGMRVEDGPNGQRVSSRSGLPSVNAGAIGAPWDVSFAGSSGAYTATFVDCLIKRDSFTIMVGTDGVIEYAMPSTPTTLYVGFQYDTESGVVTIISGATLADVSECKLPVSNVELVKTPLYIMTLSGGWRVAKNLREIPSVGLAN